MGIFTIKHYSTEVEKQNRFYEKNCAKSLDIYDRRMYIDIYNIYKLLPVIPQNEEFKNLIKDVRSVRLTKYTLTRIYAYGNLIYR